MSKCHYLKENGRIAVLYHICDTGVRCLEVGPIISRKFRFIDWLYTLAIHKHINVFKKCNTNLWIYPLISHTSNQKQIIHF